jgi:predicted dehydrogenase
MRRLVLDGAVGPVLAVHGTFAEPTAAGWRVDGEGAGPLLDLASHQADALRFLLADEAVWVDAAPGDSTTAIFRVGLAGGAVASLVASFAGAREDTLSLHGERGVLQLDRYARRLTLASTGPKWTVRRSRVRAGDSMGARARRLVRPTHDPSYAATLGAWVDAIAGAPSDTPSLQDGLRSLEIVDAAAAAAASGERIRL